MQITYLDHYDSFTYNLLDWLFYDTDIEPFILSCDALESYQLIQPIILSPGPHRPEKLAETMALVRRSLGKVPIFGICLGHQCLASALGGTIVRAQKPIHGSRQRVDVIKKFPLINGLSTSFLAAHYNSLVVERGSIPEDWVWAENKYGEIEGIVWRGSCTDSPALGVQFHPESFLTDDLQSLRLYWLETVRQFYRNRQAGLASPPE